MLVQNIVPYYARAQSNRSGYKQPYSWDTFYLHDLFPLNYNSLISSYKFLLKHEIMVGENESNATQAHFLDGSATGSRFKTTGSHTNSI